MLNNKIKIAIFMVSVLIMIVTCFLLIPPKILTKENNKGNEYKQLDRLMNTTRYAEQVRKAGYQVDDYDLEMMDRIPKLKTKGEAKIIILSPSNDRKLYTYLDDRSKLIIFDENMNIAGSVINQDKDKHRRKLTEEEKSKYEKEIKEEINKLLDDVYKAGKE